MADSFNKCNICSKTNVPLGGYYCTDCKKAFCICKECHEKSSTICKGCYISMILCNNCLYITECYNCTGKFCPKCAKNLT